MGPAQAGDWRAKLLVVGVVGLICAGLYPTVVVPLQIAYGGKPRPERDPNLRPGFEKRSMWGQLDSHIKQQQQDGSDAPAAADQQQQR